MDQVYRDYGELEKIRSALAKKLGCRRESIIFTGGAYSSGSPCYLHRSGDGSHSGSLTLLPVQPMLMIPPHAQEEIPIRFKPVEGGYELTLRGETVVLSDATDPRLDAVLDGVINSVQAVVYRRVLGA